MKSLYPNNKLTYSVASCALVCLLSLPLLAQQSNPKTPVVVQPGAPGQPTRTLPSSTRATLPPVSPADVQFMQDMIMHHAQAVEMTALIESHTENKEITIARRANQQLAVRRNQVYETVAGRQGRTDFDADE